MDVTVKHRSCNVINFIIHNYMIHFISKCSLSWPFSQYPVIECALLFMVLKIPLSHVTTLVEFLELPSFWRYSTSFDMQTTQLVTS